jgi:hypothetical protein
MKNKTIIFVVFIFFAIFIFAFSSIIVSKNQTDSNQDYETYFSLLKQKNKNVELYYKSLKSVLSASLASDLIAIYGSQVLERNSSTEYNNFFQTLVSKIKENSQEVYNEIIEKEALLTADPFIHQVMLNLVADLEISTNQKVKFMGKVLENEFVVENSGNISEKSAALTIALIQMKKAKVSVEELRPYIQNGLYKNKANNKSLKEFIARVSTFYPEWAPKSIH